LNIYLEGIISLWHFL